MSALQTPKDWEGRAVSTLDVLLFMRQKMGEGIIPEMFIGKVDAHRMEAFTIGLSTAIYYNHLPDPGFMRFLDWLRDSKKAFPPGGWAQQYLADCHGDHRAAINKFLDYAAEFVAQQERPSPA
jgi:hypothetical protein